MTWKSLRDFVADREQRARQAEAVRVTGDAVRDAAVAETTAEDERLVCAGAYNLSIAKNNVLDAQAKRRSAVAAYLEVKRRLEGGEDG